MELRQLTAFVEVATSGISDAPHTIELHVRHLIEKLGVHSKLQAVIAAARLGLIDLAMEE